MKTLTHCLVAMGALIGVSQASAANINVQVLSAVVKDEKIADAAVIMQRNGEQSQQVKTSAGGQAVVVSTMPDDASTLMIIKKAGYSPLVVKCPCQDMTYALSPNMTNLDGLRVVLNWGAKPKDLDSHMAYPENHIFWNNRKGEAAYLDVDDTTSFGPETITIDSKKSGQSYVYAVHDYSDRNLPSSPSLSQSGAKVMVYVGQSLVRSYYVPQNVTGNLWTVFRVTGEGEFQDINTLKGTTRDANGVLDDVMTYTNASTQVIAQVASSDNVTRAKALNNQATDLYKRGDLEGAVAFYQQAVDLNPEDAQVYSNLGLLYIKLNRSSEAIWANRKALALATGQRAATVKASSYYNIGMVYEKAEQWQQALEQFTLASQQKSMPVYNKAIDRMKQKLGQTQ